VGILPIIGWHRAQSVAQVKFQKKVITSPKENSLVTKKIVITNQVKFSEHEFPFRNKKMVEKDLIDNSTEMQFQHPSNVKWAP
jgi:hypothetical protein